MTGSAGVGSLNWCYDSSPAAQLTNGNLIQPIYCATSGTGIGWPLAAGVEISTNSGSTWGSFIPVCPATTGANGCDESAVVQMTSGNVVMISRVGNYPNQTDDTPGTYYRSVSTNNGTTWSTPVQVISNNSVVGRPTLLALSNDVLLLEARCTFNINYTIEHCAWLSYDEGLTWSAASDVNIVAGSNEYSAMTLDANGNVGILQSTYNGSIDLSYQQINPYGVVIPPGLSLGQNQTFHNATLGGSQTTATSYFAISWAAGTSDLATFANTSPLATVANISLNPGWALPPQLQAYKYLYNVGGFKIILPTSYTTRSTFFDLNPFGLQLSALPSYSTTPTSVVTSDGSGNVGTLTLAASTGKVPTGPTSAVVSGDAICYTGTTGQQSDCGYAPGAIPTTTMVSGSGSGNYNITSTSYASIDSTNLTYTTTIPSGWKLIIGANGSVQQVAAAGTQNCTYSLHDSVGGTLVPEIPMDSLGTGGARTALSLSSVLTGDGNSHTIRLQVKTSNASYACTINNTSSTATAVMTFLLQKSN
jgi:hypothetical protein